MCLAIMFMCVSGPLMWWRRRPKGRAPGRPAGQDAAPGVAAAAWSRSRSASSCRCSALSLLVVLLLDQLVLRRVPALAGWFGSS